MDRPTSGPAPRWRWGLTRYYHVVTPGAWVAPVQKLDGVDVRCPNCGATAASLQRHRGVLRRSDVQYFTKCRSCGHIEDVFGSAPMSMVADVAPEAIEQLFGPR